MAKIRISTDENLDLIAIAAGQADMRKRIYKEGFLIVEDVSQEDLEAAAKNPPKPVRVPPSDIEVRLFAIEKKIGITDKDKEDAKDEILKGKPLKIDAKH
jgi:hypothetical protein